MPSNPAPTFERPSRHAATLILLALCLVVGAGMFILVEKQPSISDPLGYLKAGESIARGQGPTFRDAQGLQPAPFFSMYAFQIARENSPDMYLGFPPGFPLLLALPIALFRSSSAAIYIAPLLAVLAILLTFANGKLLTRNRWSAVLAATLLAISPMLWTYGTAVWSEVPATGFVLGGCGLYLWSRRSAGDERGRMLAGVGAAALLGFSFLIRYTNVAFILPIAAYELYTGRERIWSERWRWPGYAALAAAVAIIPIFNLVYYGGLTTTSYSPIHGWYAQAPFAFSYALGPSFVDGYSLLRMLATLWQNFPVVILLLPVGLYFLRPAERLFVALATFGTLGIYAVYAFAPTGINSRFLLPALPFVAIAMAAAVQGLLARLPSASGAAAVGVALVLVLAAVLLPPQLRELAERNRASDATAAHIRQVAAALPEDAVVISYELNDLLAYYGHRSVLSYRRIPPSDVAEGRYRMEALVPCLVETVDGLLAAGYPVYHIPIDPAGYWSVSDIIATNYVQEDVNAPVPMAQVMAHLDSRPAPATTCSEHVTPANRP